MGQGGAFGEVWMLHEANTHPAFPRRQEGTHSQPQCCKTCIFPCEAPVEMRRAAAFLHVASAGVIIQQ